MLSGQVTVLSNAIAGPDGVLAQHVMKVAATRADGKKVFGAIGLASTAVNDTSESQILLEADKLLFVPPGSPNATPSGVMEVGLVDGVLTLRIPAARIGDATIGAGKIAVPTLAAITAILGDIVSGTITLDSSGHIKSGQTDWKTGDGWWLGRHGGEPALSIGNEVSGGIAYKPSLGPIQLYKPNIVAAPGPAQFMGDYYPGSARTGAGSLTVTAGIEFRDDGTIYQNSNRFGTTTYTKVGEYYKPVTSGIGSQFSVRFNLVGGGSSGGTLTGTLSSAQVINVARALSLSFTESANAIAYRDLNYTVFRQSDGAQVGGGFIHLEIERAV